MMSLFTIKKITAGTIRIDDIDIPNGTGDITENETVVIEGSETNNLGQIMQSSTLLEYVESGDIVAVVDGIQQTQDQTLALLLPYSTKNGTVAVKLSDNYIGEVLATTAVPVTGSAGQFLVNHQTGTIWTYDDIGGAFVDSNIVATADNVISTDVTIIGGSQPVQLTDSYQTLNGNLLLLSTIEGIAAETNTVAKMATLSTTTKAIRFDLPVIESGDELFIGEYNGGGGNSLNDKNNWDWAVKVFRTGNGYKMTAHQSFNGNVNFGKGGTIDVRVNAGDEVEIRIDSILKFTSNVAIASEIDVSLGHSFVDSIFPKYSVLDVESEQAGQTPGGSENLPYIPQKYANLDGLDDHVDFGSDASFDDLFLDQDWSFGFVLPNGWLAPSGDQSVLLRRGVGQRASYVGLEYSYGSTYSYGYIWWGAADDVSFFQGLSGLTTDTLPVSGDCIHFTYTASDNTLRMYKNGDLVEETSATAFSAVNNSVTGSTVSFGNTISQREAFIGGLDGLWIMVGTVAPTSASLDQQQDKNLANQSWYTDVTHDYSGMGEGAFPAVIDRKSNADGTFINGDEEEAFVSYESL